MATEQTQALASLLSKARLQWESRLREELLALGMRQRRLCLLRERPGADEEEEVPWEGPHFVYTAEDLLDFVSGLRSDNASTASFSPASSSSASLPVLIRLPMQTPLLPTLQRYYALLKRKPPGDRNGTATASSNGVEGKKQQQQPLIPEEEEAQRLAAGIALLRSLRACVNNSGKKTGGTTNTEERQRLSTLLRDFCKAGPVPPGLRAEIWSFLLLGASTTVSAGTAGTGGEEKAALTAAATAAAAATVAFERLLEHCQRWEIITDDLLRFDVEATVEREDFFIFSDAIDELVMCLARDASVPALCSIQPASVAPLTTVLPPPPASASSVSTLPRLLPFVDEAATVGAGGKGNGEVRSIPPCQMVPYYRQSMLAGPVCYLFQRPEEGYPVWKALFTRFFVRLTVVSSEPNTVVFIAKMFEDLMTTHLPHVYQHCISLDIFPLSIAFPWMVTAFAGVLRVDDTLDLWDGLIAWQTLDLLPLAAVAVFSHLAPQLLQAKAASDLRALLCPPQGLTLSDQLTLPSGQHYWTMGSPAAARRKAGIIAVLRAFLFQELGLAGKGGNGKP